MAEAMTDQEIAEILEDDTTMMRWAASVTMMDYPPVVRASTYDYPGRGDIYTKHFGRHPDRPVVMRGARHVRSALWSTKSAYANVLTDRFLKRIKFTAVCPDEMDKMSEWLCSRLDQKGIYYSKPPCRWSGIHVWMNGEVIFPKESEMRRLRVGLPVQTSEIMHSPFTKSGEPPMLPRPRRSESRSVDKRIRREAAYRVLTELGIRF